jgi:CheY-like chemotaxis protein
MPERLVLIVEDDEEAVFSWKRDITEFNRDKTQPFQFVAEFARSRLAAVRALDRLRINCAVIDLRLPESDDSAGDADPIGNNVLEKLLLEVGVPAVVYSGHPDEASELVKSSEIKRILKAKGGAMEALLWLAGHDRLMSAMESTKRKIAQESARLFSKSIWPRWKNALKSIEDPDVLAGVITRQTASHVAEELARPPAYHHPEEFYIVPPLSDRLGTGDLLRLGDVVFVVVTPRCNIARDSYPNYLMLAVCQPMDEALTTMRTQFGDSKTKQEKAERELHNLATQGHSIASHFLPPGSGFGPWLVDFKEIMTMPSTEVEKLLAGRFASIAGPFVPNLVQRYAAYIGRIGQPDLDRDILRVQVCQ